MEIHKGFNNQMMDTHPFSQVDDSAGTALPRKRTFGLIMAVVTLSLFGLLGAQSVQAQTTTMEWLSLGLAAEAEIPSGSVLTDTGGNVDMTITWTTVTDGGTFVPFGRPAFVTFEGGTTQGNATNYAGFNFDNSRDDPDDRIVATFTFSQPVTGLAFSLLDVDQGSWDDGVEIYFNGNNNIVGSGYVASIGSAVALDNESYMTGYEGTGSVEPTSTAGNINLDFGVTAVTSIRIEYFSTDDAPSNPGGQLLGDL